VREGGVLATREGLSGWRVARTTATHLWREGDLWVAQCLQVDVASQGETEEEALANLKEALELFFEPPTPSRIPEVRAAEVELGPAA
jgi:predicted RNase H-like HicB family nuclease